MMILEKKTGSEYKSNIFYHKIPFFQGPVKSSLQLLSLAWQVACDCLFCDSAVREFGTSRALHVSEDAVGGTGFFETSTEPIAKDFNLPCQSNIYGGLKGPKIW